MSKGNLFGRLFKGKDIEEEVYVSSEDCATCNPDPLADEDTEHTIKEYLEENPVDLEQLEKENVERKMKDILESKAFPNDDVEVSYDFEEGSYTFKLSYKHTTPENEEYGELYLPKKLKDETKEMVEHPDHYNQTPVETIEEFFLATAGNDDMVKGALLYNIIKYTSRAGHKGSAEEDNSKTKFFLDLTKHLFPDDYKNYRKYQSFKKK